MSVQSIPKGYHTITPYLVVKDVDEVVTFIQKAFDARVDASIKNEDQQTMHAEITIGDSKLMIGREQEPGTATSSMLYLYMKDTDNVYKKALKAGGVSIMEPTDQFYGDRNAAVQGPSDTQWWIGTHIEDVSPEEIQKRAKAFYQSHSAA